MDSVDPFGWDLTSYRCVHVETYFESSVNVGSASRGRARTYTRNDCTSDCFQKMSKCTYVSVRVRRFRGRLLLCPIHLPITRCRTIFVFDRASGLSCGVWVLERSDIIVINTWFTARDVFTLGTISRTTVLGGEYRRAVNR